MCAHVPWVNKEHTGGVLRVVFTTAYICTSYCIFYGSSSMWAYSIVSASTTVSLQLLGRQPFAFSLIMYEHRGAEAKDRVFATWIASASSARR